LGLLFLACVFVSGVGAALCFWLFTFKNQSTLKNKSNVLHVGRTKTMTKIKAEGTAWGVSKRAMPSRDGGILLTWGISFFLSELFACKSFS